MNYKIKSMGFNCNINETSYTLIPFTYNAFIIIKCLKKGILKFDLIQNKNPINITIYKKKDKINVINQTNELVFECKEDEIIKIVPQIKNKSKCEIVIKNFIIIDEIDVPPSENDKIDTAENDKIDIEPSENDKIDVRKDYKYKITEVNKIDELTDELDIISKKINKIYVPDNKINETSEINNKIINFNNNEFIIVTTRWGIKIAESLKNMLEEFGYKTSIIIDSISNEILKNNKTRPNEYFIILFSHLVSKMPEPNKYIIYQLEQKRQSMLITQKVLNNISNSLITWDYSNENIANFDIQYNKKIVFQPISIINNIQESNFAIKYDLLFFGVNCARRTNILNYLKRKKYNIFITNSIFGENLYKIITQSKIILNLHVYEDAILEIARLNEVLPFNKLIISELPCDGDYENKNFYQDKIVFCDVISKNLSNISKLTNLIDYYLKPDNYNEFMATNRDSINKIYCNSLEFLKKNLNLINKLTNKCENNNINDKKNVFVISAIEGGGALKYLNDIKNHYNDINFIVVKKNSKLLTYKYSANDILFIQHLFFTDINIRTIIDIKNKFNLKIIISIHDFYWLNRSVLRKFDETHSWENAYLSKNIIINDDITKLFNVADDIIHPSKFTFDIYSKYFSLNNFKLVYHNDYETNYNSKHIPQIFNNTINVGVLHTYSIIKGSEYIDILSKKYVNYKNMNIVWHIVGKNIPSYKELEFYEYIKKYNLHCLTYLNKLGETWCYSLTKGINSGLPLIYNNIGAFKERIPPNTEHYFKVYDDKDDKNDNGFFKICKVFENMIDYIILNNGKYNITNYNNEIIYNDYYNNLFGCGKINKNNKINMFAIYFPQFHKIKENDKNYYEDYSDIKNLSLYFNENPQNLENLNKPLLSLYNLNNIEEYDLTNNNITDIQIKIAKTYGLKGFAVYYYWFSVNTITNENLIMKKGYENLFKDNYDNFKIFFVWANEDWSNNPAFNTRDNIYNIYDEHNIVKNINNLMNYFKHDNYYKINNKPVFMIHHPWFISDDKLNLFRNILNSKCIENNFDGVNLILNSMNKTYVNYNNYDFHPNYKIPPISSSYKLGGKNVLDYEMYTKNIKLKKNQIQSVFFDFNNTARLYKPNKLDKSTRVIKNTTDNIQSYINKIKNIYLTSNTSEEINKICLINAWNEWGEKMHIEPSEENGFTQLNFIKKIAQI